MRFCSGVFLLRTRDVILNVTWRHRRTTVSHDKKEYQIRKSYPYKMYYYFYYYRSNEFSLQISSNFKNISTASRSLQQLRQRNVVAPFWQIDLRIAKWRTEEMKKIFVEKVATIPSAFVWSICDVWTPHCCIVWPTGECLLEKRECCLINLPYWWS